MTNYEGTTQKNWPDLWNAATRVLETITAPTTLKAWLPQIVYLGIEQDSTGCSVRFGASSDFVGQMVRKNLQLPLEQAFTQVTGFPTRLELLIDSELFKIHAQTKSAPTLQNNTQSSTEQNNGSGEQPSAEIEKPVTKNFLIHAGSRILYENGVNPRYTFDSYVVGASNQFAYASAQAIAERPGTQYNPVFIYSSPGLGKTHLLHAVGNQLLKKNPHFRMIYVSAEQFLNELVDSIQKKKMSHFRDKYRNTVDCLLLDDVQFLSGKDGTQEELFHTFNEFYNSKRQIVITSDRPPKDIQNLEERIQTRFAWGLISNIHAPEIETRIAILKAKAEREDVFLPDDVATFLASYIKTNVRDLESIIIKLRANSSFLGAEISLEMARLELRNLIPEEAGLQTADSIQAAVIKFFGIKPSDLRSDVRSAKVSIPRHISMYLCRKYARMNYKDIGQLFGGKDHSTVISACRKIEKMIESDADLQSKVEGVQNLL